ncbi:MAG: glycerate kinase, partial [Kiritimatiellia bacterium]
TLLSDAERNPLHTTTYGVGEWIRDAMERGFCDLTLAVGGSVTVDGGVGMAQALGWRFLDAMGAELDFGGGELVRLEKVIPPSALPDLRVRVMCDVTNPLTGEKGAARVFAPQKGATPEQVELLEAGLLRLSDCIRRDLGRDLSSLPGGGAAGGIAAGAVAFLGAELVSGVEEMIRLSGLSAKIREADCVITGEGRVDGQSLDGKVLSGILHEAAGRTRVAVIAGSCQLSPEEMTRAGLDAALSANHRNLPLDQALQQAAGLAEAAGRRFALENLC